MLTRTFSSPRWGSVLDDQPIGGFLRGTSSFGANQGQTLAAESPRQAGCCVNVRGVERGRRMHMFLGATVLAVITPWCSSAGEPRQAIPDQAIVYRIYENTEEPQERRVAFTAELTLTAVQTVGDSVGWQITEVRLHRLGTKGETEAAWVEPFPFFESFDGLWWIQHHDPHAPQLSDFARSPCLTGLAYSETPGERDLVYRLEDVAHVSAADGQPFEVTAALDYLFLRAGSSEPEGEGDDEPAGVEPDGSDPPAGGPDEMAHTARPQAGECDAVPAAAGPGVPRTERTQQRTKTTSPRSAADGAKLADE